MYPFTDPLTSKSESVSAGSWRAAGGRGQQELEEAADMISAIPQLDGTEKPESTSHPKGVRALPEAPTRAQVVDGSASGTADQVFPAVYPLVGARPQRAVSHHDQFQPLPSCSQTGSQPLGPVGQHPGPTVTIVQPHLVPSAEPDSTAQNGQLLPPRAGQESHDHDLDEDILSVMFLTERIYMANSNYLEQQPGLTDHMIHVVVDWMLEVTMEFRLSTEIFYQGCSMFHRVLSRMRCSKENLQLVAVTCLFIASKVEMPRPPSVTRFSYISDYTFSTQDVLRMEREILRRLDWLVCSTTPRSFIVLFSKIAGLEPRDMALAMYLCELSLRDTHFLPFPPSEIVVSAITLASGNYTRVQPDLQRLTNYTIDHLRPCMETILEQWIHCTRGNKSTSFAKFARQNFYRASTRDPPSKL